VIINVKGPEAVRVTLDGVDVPSAVFGIKRLTDPGHHVVRALAVGHSPAEAAVTLAEGRVETVTLELRPGPGGPTDLSGPGGPGTTTPPDTSASTRRKIGFAGIGVGAAGLIAGAVFGGLAMGERNTILKSCPMGTCPFGSNTVNDPSISTYNTYGAVSTAGFVAGGVLAATGVVLVVTAPSSSTAKASFSPVLGAGYLGARGRF
jgi:hypothetical protein